MRSCVREHLQEEAKIPRVPSLSLSLFLSLFLSLSHTHLQEEAQILRVAETAVQARGEGDRRLAADVGALEVREHLRGLRGRAAERKRKKERERERGRERDRRGRVKEGGREKETVTVTGE